MAKKPCEALAAAICRPPPFGRGGPYPIIQIEDLDQLLVLLMQRLGDNPDDSNVIWDFSECFGLNRRAVSAAVRAYRHASATLH